MLVTPLPSILTINPDCHKEASGNETPKTTKPGETNMLTKDFVLAGNAIFTVANAKGERYTFKVVHKESTGRFPEAWMAFLLTGPDNTKNYTYMGMVNPNTGAVFHTKASAKFANSLPLKVANWSLNSIVWGGKTLPAGYTAEHAGRCGRCGRMLTVPESIQSGIGPECAKKL